MPSFIPRNYLSGEQTVEVGCPAPDFALPDQNGNEWRLSRQRGKVIALLFYPQNETLVCTRQMCSVKKYWQEYLETKAEVVGVSPNTVENHQHFSTKYKLPLPILADETNQVTALYSHHWIMPVNFTRAIIVVDGSGIIRTRKVMLRALRPADRSVIATIYAARADELSKNYEAIKSSFSSLLDYRI